MPQFQPREAMIKFISSFLLKGLLMSVSFINPNIRWGVKLGLSGSSRWTQTLQTERAKFTVVVARASVRSCLLKIKVKCCSEVRRRGGLVNSVCDVRPRGSCAVPPKAGLESKIQCVCWIKQKNFWALSLIHL